MKIKLPETLNDLTLSQYINFVKVAETIKDDGSIESTLNTYKLIEILCGVSEEEIDSLTLPEMAELTAAAKILIDEFTGFSQENKAFEIDGTLYCARKMEELDNGEYISLNILKEQHGGDLYTLFPKLLAILIRPGQEVKDEETGETYYQIEKFNRRDMANLEWRANLFLEKAKASDVIPVINFFLNMKEQSV